MKSLLEKLQIDEVNPGACTEANKWLTVPQGEKFHSYNPTTGEVIVSVIKASPETYK